MTLPKRSGARLPVVSANAPSRSLVGAVLAALSGFAVLAPVPGHASDMKSIGIDAAVLYDAPTLRGRRVAIAPRGMPVDPVVAESDWVRVRDYTGQFFWVEKKALSDKRMLIVNTPAGTVATVRADAAEAAPVVFQAYPGVLLEMLEPARAGWVRVRHRDGQSGYVAVSEVWGE